MSVADCLQEYERLANEVFGNPRIISKIRYAFPKRAKFDAKKLERVIRGVANKRGEECEEEKTMPSDEWLCKT